MVDEPMEPNRGDDELRNNPVRVSEHSHFDYVVPPFTEWFPAKDVCVRSTAAKDVLEVEGRQQTSRR